MSDSAFCSAVSDGAFNAQLWDTLVDPQYQGLELDKSLLKEVIRELVSMGVTNITALASKSGAARAPPCFCHPAVLSYWGLNLLHSACRRMEAVREDRLSAQPGWRYKHVLAGQESAVTVTFAFRPRVRRPGLVCCACSGRLVPAPCAWSASTAGPPARPQRPRLRSA